MFSPKTISFLRNLKRNNDREWFRGHKVEYEQHVRTPIVALLARLDEDFQTFAPELVAHPSVSLFRIYRDTRFSANKSPLKTQVGAYFPHRAMRKRGAGLYIEVGPDRVYIGGGLYMPNTADLQAIREHVASHHARLRRIVTSAGFRRTVGELQGNQLQRVPRGFPKDHPAADYLRFRQFLAGTESPAAFAYNPGFYRELLSVFRQVAPLVQFLNQPLTST
jgi:uncharacterized protein (TIGR02453 family)